MSSANSHSSSTESIKFSPVAFNHPLSIKLSTDNFLIWRKQIVSTVRGHRLHHYLDDSVSPPPKFATPADKTAGTINSEFLDWEQQDQLILSWILASVSEGVLPRLINCDTASQVWSTIESYFSQQIRAKVSQYKLQLQNQKKGSLTMNEYLLKIRTCVDLLALVGHKLEAKSHIDAIFDGLPPEYDTFILSVNTRLDPYSVSDIEGLLLSQEARVEKHFKSLESAMANVAVNSNSQNNSNPQQYGNKPQSFHQTGGGRGGYNRNQYNQTGGGRGGYHNNGGNWNNNQRRGGTGRGNWKYNNNKVWCQNCGRPNHTAPFCYFKDHPDHNPPNTPQGHIAYASTPQFQAFMNSFNPAPPPPPSGYQSAYLSTP